MINRQSTEELTSCLPFQQEWQTVLERLRKNNAVIPAMKYFFQLAEEQADLQRLENHAAQLILLGPGFPQEILMATGAEYQMLACGTFASASWGEPMVPRDTDSVTKSTLGQLAYHQWAIAKNALVIVPIYSDSMKKLAEMLSTEMKVLAVEMPSDKRDPIQQKHWREEISRAVQQIEKHLRHRISARELEKQRSLLQETRMLWRQCMRQYGHQLDGSSKLFLANSWFWTTDKAGWKAQLEQLMNELGQRSGQLAAHRPKVLLLGSPVYMPNFKLPFLLEELDMELADSINPMMHFMEEETLHRSQAAGKLRCLEQLAADTLQQDISTAYVQNTTMEQLVASKLSEQEFDGVVVHVLKGQIEYDFELNALERLFEQYHVPVFRLETDYNYQDIEQLRIRLEAFGEMMRHRAALMERGA